MLNCSGGLDGAFKNLGLALGNEPSRAENEVEQDDDDSSAEYESLSCMVYELDVEEVYGNS